MQCEMCGKNMDFLKKSLIEGVEMNVCPGCAKFGKPIPKKTLPQKRVLTEGQKREVIKRVFRLKEMDNTETIVDNYGDVIRNARTKKQMSQTALAVKLAEKESVIHAIETSRHEPRMELAKKLEKLLEIKLIEKSESKESDKEVLSQFKSSPKGRSDKMTLGDMITIRKRR